MSGSIVSLEPGPTVVDEQVIQAMCRPVIHHQSPEFIDILDRTCDLLGGVYGTEGEVVVLPASGRGAVEAVMTSVREDARSLVVPTNGSFGRMMATIGRSVGFNVIELEHAPGETIRKDEVATALADLDRPLLGVVHNETATGMVNNLFGYSEMVRERDGLLLVDAVSSLGGTNLDHDAFGVDFCVSAAQKSMGALAGLSFVAVSERGMQHLERRPALLRGNYLDMWRWWDLWLPAHRGGRLSSGYRRLPWTMPTHLVCALLRASELIYEEGHKQRYQRHQRCAQALRAGLRAMNCQTVAPVGCESNTVTAFGHTDIDAKQMKQTLSGRYGVRLVTGVDNNAANVLRVAHMADTARPGPQVQMLAALASEFANNGIELLSDPLRAFYDSWYATDTAEES